MLYEGNSIYDKNTPQGTCPYVEVALYRIHPLLKRLQKGFVIVGKYSNNKCYSYKPILIFFNQFDCDEIEDIWQAIKQTKMIFEEYLIIANGNQLFSEEEIPCDRIA